MDHEVPLTSMSCSSASPQLYVTIEGKEHQRIIFPAWAAERSRLLSHLCKSLFLMEIHRWRNEGNSSLIDGASENEEDFHSARSPSEVSVDQSSFLILEEEEEANLYQSFACYPLPNSPSGNSSSEADKFNLAATRLLDVVIPLQNISMDSLYRVVEYLMMRHPNGKQVLSDLKPSSAEDASKVKNLIIASDFLQC